MSFAVLLAVLRLASAPLWLLYAPLRLLLPRPPIVPSASTWARALTLTLTARPPAPGLALSTRLGLLASLMQRFAFAPAWGLAWYLDEALYGRHLAAVPVTAPLFELSAARSGSTQLAHYLEADTRLCAPNVLQSIVPVRWAWAVAERLSPLFPREVVRAKMEAAVPPAFLQRHELDPFAMDTLEVMFASFHLGDLYAQLGPDPFREGYDPARITATNAGFWGDFVDYVDALGRKTLLGQPPERRLFLKGHFLAAGDALAARYPDARFLTVLRDPEPRIRSVVNFHHFQPTDPWLPAVPLPWLAVRDLAMELDYCDAEAAWFGRAPTEGPRRYAILFDDYRQDLAGTVARVYTEGLGMAPPTVAFTHASRKRHGYSVDHSLDELGIDVAALRTRLADYRRWVEGRSRPIVTG